MRIKINKFKLNKKKIIKQNKFKMIIKITKINKNK